ncbi:MAG: toprim domain-containing protein [Comamonadaceae bacterium]|nr:toprim domain-containing protein [Comamonadaceae bacterium]
MTHKGECPACGSSDANAHYTDGHTHCFSCGKHTPATGAPSTPTRSARVADDFSPIEGAIQALSKRGISEETCRHFGYRVGPLTEQAQRRLPRDLQDTIPVGTKLQLAPYFDASGQVVAQKFRTAGKDFGVFGKLKNALPLFGQHLWRDGGKKVVITEGEIDAMSVSQVQGNKWPVVSVPNGAQGAKKSLAAALEWLERFDEVILMFDQDQPGRDAVAECAPLFTPGRCKVASLPLKDANEMLTAGKGPQIIEAIWGAKPYRPDGIRSVEELADQAAEDIPRGDPWWLEALDGLTYGRRPGEIYAFGAGTGVGKTDWFTQSIAHDLLELGLTVGVLYLEQPPVETIRRIAGKAVGRVLHVPGKATVEERREAIAKLTATQRLHLYDSFGAIDWETIKSKIRYMVVSLGCRAIYLDHLTALVAAEEDERKTLDAIMAEMATLALELGCYIHFISHLTRPEGKPHEEGGRVQIRHFRGSNAIGMWSHFMFGIERDQQAEDEADRITVFRILKDRNTGQATGKTIPLTYDPDTGLLAQGTAPEPSPFKDRSPEASLPWEGPSDF